MFHMQHSGSAISRRYRRPAQIRQREDAGHFHPNEIGRIE